MIIDNFHPPILGQVNIKCITKMDVETIYKDKLKGKYKLKFDQKEKQKCLLRREDTDFTH